MIASNGVRFQHRFVLVVARIVVAWIVVCSCQLANADAWALKMFSETHHDFGTVGRNAKTEHAFVIENCFEEDIHIASVRSSCGCTTPLATKTTLKSWEKGEILAQFNTRSFIGTKSAMITVVIDRPYYAEVQLTVGGTIRSDIVVEPGEIKFGDTEVGTSKSMDLKIAYAGRKEWRIVDVRGNSDALEVRLDSPTRQGSTITYMMHITLKDSNPVGDFLDEMIVVTNEADDKENQFTLPVTAKIRPPITVTPELLSLGDVHSGEPRQQKVIVKSKKPFSIASVQCEDERFQFTVPSGEKTVHVLPFSFKGELNSGEPPLSVRQRLTILTSSGDEVEATITARLVQ